MKRLAKGFSLVELMVVVAIIGILATMAVPQYERYKMRSRQVEAKQSLALVYLSEKSAIAEYNTYVSCIGLFGFDIFLQWDCGGSGQEHYTPYMHHNPHKMYYTTMSTGDEGDASWGNTSVRNAGFTNCFGGIFDCSPSRWYHMSSGGAMGGSCTDLWNDMNTYIQTTSGLPVLSGNSFTHVSAGPLKPCRVNPMDAVEIARVMDTWTIDQNKVLKHILGP